MLITHLLAVTLPVRIVHPSQLPQPELSHHLVDLLEVNDRLTSLPLFRFLQSTILSTLDLNLLKVQLSHRWDLLQQIKEYPMVDI
jgi:hypothetical protein